MTAPELASVAAPILGGLLARYNIHDARDELSGGAVRAEVARSINIAVLLIQKSFDAVAETEVVVNARLPAGTEIIGVIRE